MANEQCHHKKEVEQASIPSTTLERKDAWFDKHFVTKDHHRYKNKNRKKKWSTKCVFLICFNIMMCTIAILAILLIFLLKSSRKEIPAILRWNSTGITLLGTVGVPGSAANQVNILYGLAFDSTGALYIADDFNNRVQKLVRSSSGNFPSDGQAVTVVGSNLNMPVDLTFGFDDNMYLSDRGNERVLYFARGNTTGIVIAGVTGVPGNTSDHLSHPTGIPYNVTSRVLFLADRKNYRIMKYENGSSNGTVVAGGNGNGLGRSQLSYCYSVYFDEITNSLLMTNYYGHNVVRWPLVASNWTLVTGSLTGTPGNNSVSMNNPLAVTLDPMENIYVADENNHRIQFFPAGQSQGTTIAGISGVPGSSATQLRQPFWVTLDNQLNLYVSDTYNYRVQLYIRY